MTKSQIIHQIRLLLNELEGIRVKQNEGNRKIEKKTPAQPLKGAIGAITILNDEGFFDSPKDIGAVIKRLEEIGRYYPTPSISMNLLNLTKRRVFNRIKGKDSKNWLYVIRK